jgi:hypothetical protein
MSQNGKVLCAIAFSQTALIFSKGDIQHPIKVALFSAITKSDSLPLGCW